MGCGIGVVEVQCPVLDGEGSEVVWFLAISVLLMVHPDSGIACTDARILYWAGGVNCDEAECGGSLESGSCGGDGGERAEEEILK